MNIWFTSDTHFNHANIIKYCNRPWKTVDKDGNIILDKETMNRELISSWNNTVAKDDVVWHLGDFAFGNYGPVSEIFKQLNGKIHLVMGNHDNLDISEYYKMGFYRVYDRPVIINQYMILSHAPIEWVQNDGVYVNVFGHVHDSNVYKTVTANSCCVCVERWNYFPISYDLMSEMIMKYRNEEM